MIWILQLRTTMHRWLAPWTLSTFFALGALSAPCAADIWGYVDENGVAHLSDHQVSSRYLLFKKEAPRPQAEAFTPPPIVPEKPAFAMGQVIPVSAAVRAQFAPLIVKVARETNLDPSLLHAIITVESGYNAQAKSPAGAIGLMQLIPDTAARFGVKDIWDPLDNLRGGARYLRFLLAMFKDNLELVLAAYNAGEGAVQQAGNKIPNYAETKAYVPSVLTQYQHYSNAVGGAGPAGTTPVDREQRVRVLIR
jgi:soluble lytic murein transglycosylase-like protein